MHSKYSFRASMLTLIAHPHMILGKITEQQCGMSGIVMNRIMIHQ